MNSRKIMLYVHLSLAALFMPMLLTMPLTGGLYLLGYQGDQIKSEAFRTSGTVPEETSAQEQFFREQFAQNNIDFKFEYIRSSKTDFTFRPTSRVHYVASLLGNNEIVYSRVEPNLLKRLVELHKGHGPIAMKWFEVFFGFALILTTLSGLWLAWTAKPYRRITLISFGIGALIIALCLI